MKRVLALALTSSIVTAGVPSVGLAAGRSAAHAAEATGTIRGTAANPSGEALPEYTVHLRNLATGQLAGTTTTNGLGTFTFAGLNPGNYIVEIVSPSGTIVGSSAALPVAAGATVSVGVAATAAAAAAAAGAATAGAGLSTAMIVTTVAAAAGVVGAVAIVKHQKDKDKDKDASPSR